MGDDTRIGVVLDDRYRIDELIAKGGFGAVYRATHLPTGCDMAIKVLHTTRASDPTAAVRFQREAELLARLRDPHTVMTYELGETADGVLYIAMELLRGETLLDAFERRGTFAWREAVTIALDICSSLGEAHALGIIHRDLKPANIHLEAGLLDQVKVLDFGIAKILRGSALEDHEELTNVGEVLGTLEYMAPEQLLGGTLDDRTDIYALGVMLYELLTGSRPFQHATDPATLVREMLNRSAAPPSMLIEIDAAVAAELDRVVMRCLDCHASNRFDDVTELAMALDMLLRRDAQPAAARIAWAIASPTTTNPIVSDGEELTCFTTIPNAAACNELGLAATQPVPVTVWMSRPTLQTTVPPCPQRIARGSINPMPVFNASDLTPTRSLRIPMVYAPPPVLVTPAPTVTPTRSWVAAGMVIGSVVIGFAIAIL